MEETFLKADVTLKEQTKENPEVVELSGCTGSLLMVLEDYLVVANVGDSPIIIFKQESNGKLEAL